MDAIYTCGHDYERYSTRRNDNVLNKCAILKDGQGTAPLAKPAGSERPRRSDRPDALWSSALVVMRKAYPEGGGSLHTILITGDATPIAKVNIISGMCWSNRA